jgi:hypothetical protein
MILPRPHHCRTSALTLVEILNGIVDSDGQFNRRSAAIKGVLDSRLVIKRQLPQELLAESFGVSLAGGDERNANLSGIALAVACASNREELTRALTGAGLLEALNGLNAYDFHMGGLGVGDRSTLMRTAFDQEKMSFDTPIPLDVLASGFEAACEDFLRNEEAVTADARMALARALARTLTNTNIDRRARQLNSQYNCTADFYIRADSIQTIQTQINGGSRRRNDYADLAHFLYLTKHTVLVTDDSGMRKLAGKIGVEAISAEDLFR